MIVKTTTNIVLTLEEVNKKLAQIFKVDPNNTELAIEIKDGKAESVVLSYSETVGSEKIKEVHFDERYVYDANKK